MSKPPIEPELQLREGNFFLGDVRVAPGQHLELSLPGGGSIVGKFAWDGNPQTCPALEIQPWAFMVLRRHPTFQGVLSLGPTIDGPGLLPLIPGTRLRHIRAEVAESPSLNQVRANWPMVAAAAWHFYLAEGRGVVRLWEKDLVRPDAFLDVGMDYLAAGSDEVEQRATERDKELIRTYAPERDVLFVVVQKGGKSTGVIRARDEYPSPVEAYRLRRTALGMANN